jgi:hypothetical protein
MTETRFARWITIKPLPEDVASGSHQNTKVSTSSSKYQAQPSTLITFTAEVTMGADLYAQWCKAGFRLADDETKLL